MTGKSAYLLAIYIEENRASPPVSFGRIAELLDRSPATVTEMCQRLDGENLVEHEPYDGVTLTEEGRQVATGHHETYVILSWFFRSVLDLDDYEREAMEMAGTISQDVATRLAATLPYGSDPATEPDLRGADENTK